MSIDIDRVRAELAELGRAYGPGDVAEALRASGVIVSDAAVLATVDQLRLGSVGAGPLESLLRLDGVTDVIVNGHLQVFIDRGHGLESRPSPFRSDDEVRRLATRLAASAGRRLDDASPYVDARLADGTRLHAILAPLADPGTCLSLRVPSRRGFSLADWARSGAIDETMVALLRRVIATKAAFLISGGTGSGKTTLLATMLGLVPPGERVVIVEDSRELAPDHPHCVRLEARPANSEGAGRVALTDLVRQALRMRPDRLVLGEVRGAELTDLLNALNTGHEGGCGTVHANSSAAVPARLEALAALGGLSRDATHAQVAAAIRVVIHVVNRHGRRQVSEVGLVTRTASGIEVVEALRVDASGRAFPGPAAGRLEKVLEP